MILDFFGSCREGGGGGRAGLAVGVGTPAREAGLWVPRTGPGLLHRLHATSTRGERGTSGPSHFSAAAATGCVLGSPPGLWGVPCGDKQRPGCSKGCALQTRRELEDFAGTPIEAAA